jgi:hypothetical protein
VPLHPAFPPAVPCHRLSCGHGLGPPRPRSSSSAVRRPRCMFKNDQQHVFHPGKPLAAGWHRHELAVQTDSSPAHPQICRQLHGAPLRGPGLGHNHGPEQAFLQQGRAAVRPTSSASHRPNPSQHSCPAGALTPPLRLLSQQPPTRSLAASAARRASSRLAACSSAVR